MFLFYEQILHVNVQSSQENLLLLCARLLHLINQAVLRMNKYSIMERH